MKNLICFSLLVLLIGAEGCEKVECHRRNTGMIRVINNGTYSYSVYQNQQQIAFLDIATSHNFSYVPVGSNEFYFVSDDSGCGHPCLVIHDTITVNECQQTTYVIH